MVGGHVVLCAVTVAVALLLLASNAWAEPVTSKDVASPRANLKAQPFDLSRVRLLDGPFREAMERDRKYLHDLDGHRLLHTWRLNAGLPSEAEPYGGWERPECEVRGHTLGAEERRGKRTDQMRRAHEPTPHMPL